jgi:flagellar biosynthesis/type III secretory pathway chaperone
MDPHSILERLNAVLQDERLAIRRLDGAGVQTAAAEKASLVQRLTALSPELRTLVAPQLRGLVDQLRRNGILLVHARGILRDILRLRGAQMTPTITQAFAQKPVVGAASRLSIRG